MRSPLHLDLFEVSRHTFIRAARAQLRHAPQPNNRPDDINLWMSENTYMQGEQSGAGTNPPFHPDK